MSESGHFVHTELGIQQGYAVYFGYFLSQFFCFLFVCLFGWLFGCLFGCLFVCLIARNTLCATCPTGGS